jgi:imidazolonepropionase-like amidohydrolase
VDVALRDAINAGWHPGPRIVAAGPGITSTGGHADRRKALRGDISPDVAKSRTVVDSVHEARRAAWEILMRGADVIKIMATLSEYVRARGGQCSPELTYEAMQAICDVAHGAGRKVAAHCHGGIGVDMAIDAGVDTFEHGRFLTDDQLDRMAALGRFLVPTLSPEARRIDANDTSGSAGDRRWFAMATEAMYDTVERAHARGVQVAAGTDVGMPHVRHGELAYEMYHMTKAGMSNLAVIAAATRVAAEACDLGDALGQIRPGYTADLILVDGDPAEDLRILQRRECIGLVIQNGRITIDRRARSADTVSRAA